jgi:hypothetical protein
VLIDTGTVKWSTNDEDKDSLPHCEVGDWDGGGDWYVPVGGFDFFKGLLEGLPLDLPVSLRQSSPSLTISVANMRVESDSRHGLPLEVLRYSFPNNLGYLFFKGT